MTLPPYSSPVVDPQTGRMTEEWRSFFERLAQALEEAGIDLD